MLEISASAAGVMTYIVHYKIPNFDDKSWYLFYIWNNKQLWCLVFVYKWFSICFHMILQYMTRNLSQTIIACFLLTFTCASRISGSSIRPEAKSRLNFYHLIFLETYLRFKTYPLSGFGPWYMILKVLQLWWYRKFMHEILEMPSCRLSRIHLVRVKSYGCWFKHIYFSTIGHQFYNYHSPLVHTDVVFKNIYVSCSWMICHVPHVWFNHDGNMIILFFKILSANMDLPHGETRELLFLD